MYFVASIIGTRYGRFVTSARSKQGGGRSPTRAASDARAAIVEALSKRALLQFRYKEHLRIVAPYCYGVSTSGRDVLRGVQVRGSSPSNGMGFGKLWLVSEMADPQLLDETFEPDDPHYNPSDSAMTQIYARI